MPFSYLSLKLRSRTCDQDIFQQKERLDRYRYLHDSGSPSMHYTLKGEKNHIKEFAYLKGSDVILGAF